MGKTRRILCFLVALVMMLSIVSIGAIASAVENAVSSTNETEGTNDNSGSASDLPVANVNKLASETVTEYTVYDLFGGYTGDGKAALDPQVLMQFTAIDSAEEAKESKYAEYVTDFFIEVSGLTAPTYGKGCYLIGNYGSFGWVVIPLDGVEVANGTYPVISPIVPFTYADICESVKDFKCGIYFSEAFLGANQNVEVSLSLGLSETQDLAINCEYIQVGNSYTYGYKDLTGKTKFVVSEGLTGDVVEEIKNNVSLENFVPVNVPANAELVIKLVSVGEKIKYDIAPMVGESEVNDLTEAIIFRIPVPASVENKYVKLYHDGAYAGLYEIKGSENAKYIVVSSAEFSEFEIEPVDATPVASINGVSYETLKEAFEAAQSGDTITLLDNITIESDLNNAGKGIFNIADGVSITLDLNGKKIDVTDNSAGNFIVFYNYGEFTIKNGTVNLTATIDRDWNAQSTIVLNRGGILNVEGGTYTHNGGTDMAFVLDNSGNWYGDATTNVYEGTTLTSSYIAIRNRMEENSHGASGKATLNVYGGKIEGTSRAIWAQAASTSTTAPATGAINVSGGEIGLIDTPRSEGAVSMTTITGGTVSGFKGEVGELTVTGGTLENVTILSASGEEVDFVVNGDGVYEEIAGVAQIGDTVYATLAEAIAAAQAGDTVTLISDVTVDATITIAAGKTITLDLNGKTIAGTDTTNKSFGLITNKGNLTIKDSVGTGKITLSATQDTGYDRYSTVISNTVGGKLTVESGTIEHLGGHTMAYAIDNLTNGKGTYAETVINGGTIKSSYVGIRQFLNGVEADNILTVNGGTVTGNNTSIFFQDPSVNCNSGKLVVGENAVLGNRIYVSGTGGTPWDVELSVSAQALGTYGITTDEIPETYIIKEVNGVYGFVEKVVSVNGVGYATLAEAIAAAQDGDTVTLLDNITLSSGITISKPVIIDGTGYTITGNVTLNADIKFEGKLNILGTLYIYSGSVVVNEGADVDCSTTFGIWDGGALTVYGELSASSIYFNGGAIDIYGTLIATPGNDGGFILNGADDTVNVFAGATLDVSYVDIYKTSGNSTVNVYGTAKVGFKLSDGSGKFTWNVVNGGSLTASKNGIVMNNSASVIAIGEGAETVEIAKLSNKGVITVSDGTVKINGTLTNDGTFVVTGGTFSFDPTTYVADGYVALKNLDGMYVVGKKPSATVNDLGGTTLPAGGYGVWDGKNYTQKGDVELPLSFVMQFLADQSAADAANSPYADWYGDFVITFDGIENGSFVADGCYLAGYYGDFGWVKVPVDGMTITNGVRYPVMLGVGLGQKYDYICSGVKDFQCALYITPDILAENPNLTVNLELSVVDNSKGQEKAAEVLENKDGAYSDFIYEVTEDDYVAGDFVTEVPTLDFMGTSLVLGTNIQMNFYLDTENVYEGTKYYALITISNGESYAVPMDKWQQDATGRWFIPVAGLAAKQMNENISVELYRGVYGTDGAYSVSRQVSDCIKEYAMWTINYDKAATVEMKKLMVTMLNYGAAAQVKFGYDVETLANAGITAEQQATYGSDSVSYTDCYTNTNTGSVAYFAGDSLNLTDKIEINFYYRNLLNVASEDIEIVVSYTDYLGAAKSFTYTGADLESVTEERMKFCFSEIVAADVSTVLTVTLKVDGNVVNIVTDSIESYCAFYKNESPELAEAIVRYASAAEAYFTTK